MNCPVCIERYESSGYHKPFTIVPCGHSLCHKCLNSLQTRICPKCRVTIRDEIVNYGIIEIIEEQQTSHQNPASSDQLTADFIRSTDKIGPINEGSQPIAINNQERTIVYRGPTLENNIKK